MSAHTDTSRHLGLIYKRMQGNENTKTALMFASQLNRSVELVRFLIEHGADVNKATNRYPIQAQRLGARQAPFFAHTLWTLGALSGMPRLSNNGHSYALAQHFWLVAYVYCM